MDRINERGEDNINGIKVKSERKFIREHFIPQDGVASDDYAGFIKPEPEVPEILGDEEENLKD